MNILVLQGSPGAYPEGEPWYAVGSADNTAENKHNVVRNGNTAWMAEE